MFIIFNKDGSIFSQTQSDFVMQGSNRVNKVFVGFVDNEYLNWTCNGVFNLPNGSRFTIPGIEAQEGFEYLGVKYYGWVIELTSEVTMYAGTMTLTVQAVNQQANVLYTYLTNIIVNQTGLPLDGFWDNSITVAQFNDYMAQLAVKLQANTVSVVISENQLPAVGVKNVLYFVVGEASGTPYQVKMWNGSEYALLGTINLSSFASKEEQKVFEQQVLSQIGQIRSEVTNPFDVVSTTQDLPSTDQHKLYIVRANNHWYYWNGTQYTDGGAFIDSGITIENLEGQFSELGQALYDYIEERFNNGDHRPFTMSVESIQDWQGNPYQDEPFGNIFGWYDEFNGDVVIVASVGIFVLQADYITAPRIEDIVLAVNVNYDNEYSRLASKNAQDAIDELAIKANQLEITKANKDGYYQQMRAGLADNLASPDGITQDATFALRASGGTASITDGFAEIKEVKGRTLVVNQLYKTEVETTEKNGITFTNNGDGTWTVNGTASTNTTLTLMNMKVEENASYLLVGCPLGASTTTFELQLVGTGFDLRDYGEGNIVKSTVSTNVYLYILVRANATMNNVIIKPRIHNLTKMFGAGKEPATVAEFNNITRYIDTETYNEGTPISMTADEIESIGFNAFDGELEQGGIDGNGNKFSSLYNVRSKNFIHVVCGETYTWVESATSNKWKNRYIVMYDKNQNWIGDKGFGNSVGGFGKYSSGKLNDNCCYIKLEYYAEQTVTPNDFSEICLHLTHSGYRNGQYEPYWKETRELPTLAYFPEGMNDAGTAYDTLTPTKAIKRIGSVDLGTLTYYKTDNVFLADLVGAKKPENNNTKANILCAKYTTETKAVVQYNDADKTIAVSTSGQIFIQDSDYTDATTFKQAMSGVILYYELADPVETEIPQTRAEDWFYRVSDFGTEGANKFISAEIFYMNNLRDKLRNLPDIPKCEDTTGTSVLKCINGTYIWVKEE